MNDLYGKEWYERFVWKKNLAQKRKLTERKQFFLSKYCLSFSLSPERLNFSVSFIPDVCLHEKCECTY